MHVGRVHAHLAAACRQSAVTFAPSGLRKTAASVVAWRAGCRQVQLQVCMHLVTSQWGKPETSSTQHARGPLPCTVKHTDNNALSASRLSKTSLTSLNHHPRACTCAGTPAHAHVDAYMYIHICICIQTHAVAASFLSAVCMRRCKRS